MKPPREEMHSLHEVAKAGNFLASTLKEFGVKELDPHFDIPPHLVAFRGTGERQGGLERHGVLVEVICEDVDREQGLNAAYMLAAMDCVAIAVTFDAHMTSSALNPRTGKEWEKGEMQGLCDGEGACDTGLLTDCLVTTAVFADGKIASCTHPYHWHEAKREVAWVTNDVSELLDEAKDGAVVDGYIVQNMRHLMKEGRARSAALMSGIPALMAGVKMPAHARALRDAALLKQLAGESSLIRIAPHIAQSAEEREIIQLAVDACDNLGWME